MNKKQIYLGWILLIASLAFASAEHSIAGKLGLYTITGLAIGYLMQRSRFGFAGIVKKTYHMGNSELPKAVLFLLSISLIVVAAIQYNASVHDIVIPGMSSVKTISMLTIIGGFVFGVGMIFAGACASGTLTDIGEGYIRAIIALFTFCIGSVLGVAHLDSLKQTVLADGFKFYFPDYIGYFGSVAFFLAFYALCYLGIKRYEASRKNAETFISEEYDEWEKPLAVKDETKFDLFSYATYHKFFVQRWSFYVGAVLLSLLFLVVLSTTGKNWGVTTNFTYWGGWMLQSVGIDISGIGFFQSDKVVNIMAKGFFHDAGSMRNLGIIFGTLIAALIAGGLTVTKKMSMRHFIIYLIGGLLMGYGARLASGCNIGAFYSALSSMSLSGIVFGVSLILGGVVGLKLSERFKL